MSLKSPKIGKRSGQKRILALILSVTLAVTSVVTFALLDAKAQIKTVYTMEQARAQAYANSAKLEQLLAKKETKTVQLQQAIMTIKMKQKNMSTFRWSPLLSFKFPTKPDLAEAFEFEYKPISIQYEIDVVDHQINDQKFTIYQQVNSVYLDIVMLEQEIDLNQKKLDATKKAIEKSKRKLWVGQATQGDIDAMSAKCRSLEAKISSASRNLVSRKKRLVSLTGNENIYTIYSFENPLIEADMKRSEALEPLISYTLDHDETYYEAKVAQQSAYMQLTTNYELMSEKFGNKMSMIRSYYNQALNGETINARAFKSTYKEFLEAIDKPWNGSYRILFIKFPKLWFKGATDGSRYVEDEPYALYEAALEYQDARLEAESIKADLTTQVEDAFDNFISVKNAYQELLNQVETAKRQLDKDLILNKTGIMTYDEYTSSLDNYETLQSEMMEAAKLYSSSLYEFDRLTCGAVSKYIKAGGLDVNAADGGESVLIEENVEGSHYYIESIIQNQEFRLRVQLAEELDGEITHFELWCDDIQIGTRTEIDKTMRHLALALRDVESVKIRFYNDGEFVDDCQIDPSSLSGELKITTGYQIRQTESMEIGTYTCDRNDTTNFTRVTLSPDTEEGICYYLIRTDEGKYLSTDQPIKITTTFEYLPVLETDLAKVTIEFYGTDGTKLYEGRFDTENMKLLKKQEAQ